jgi:hypothetical protein
MLGNVGLILNLGDTVTDFVGSLACDSADEAKTLIPSLAPKMTDEALEAMLAEMQKLRTSQCTCACGSNIA